MTLDETADFISMGLPKYQRDANLEFLKKVHTTVKTNGVWGYPSTGQVFWVTKNGFDLVV